MVIRTCISGEFNGWSGDTAFDLCNGQVWEQVSFSYMYRYAYRPSVTLTRTATTSSTWTMALDGASSTTSVRQVTSFARTCISSDFNGWSGETVFAMCNGQVWQQADYAYYYHYAYRPSVIIYASSYGGFRMMVDGADETIRVVRLK